MSSSTAVRVLILDDEIQAALSLRILLEDHEFEARETIRISEFRSALSESHWDVAIVDVMLPHKGRLEPVGLDIARTIHKDYPEVRVLLTSAWTSLGDEIKRCAAEIGASVVFKPIESKKFLREIRALMER